MQYEISEGEDRYAYVAIKSIAIGTLVNLKHFNIQMLNGFYFYFNYIQIIYFFSYFVHIATIRSDAVDKKRMHDIFFHV